MISVDQAQEKLTRAVHRLNQISVGLKDALGYVLAGDIRSPIHLPNADNSAVDGFVICFVDFDQVGHSCGLKIKGVIKAGDLKNPRIHRGETYRIMTGARIPKGADTVIPKEYSTVKSGHLFVSGRFAKGANVRYAGEELKKGSVLLKAGTVIHPGVVGALATIGKKHIRVFRKPDVSLIVTGNELVRVGKKLKAGQIYDSNSWTMSSALISMGVKPVRIAHVPDNRCLLKNVISKSMKTVDVVILTGGVSVGDYDFVKTILKELGVRKLFWKVSQKPGKPMYAGKKGKTFFFGLPGNPAGALTCFYEYVYPALRKMTGFARIYPARVRVKLNKPIEPDKKRQLFLKGRAYVRRARSTNGHVSVDVLARQGSHMMSAFTQANGFIVIPRGSRKMEKGDAVRFDVLPYGEHV